MHDLFICGYFLIGLYVASLCPRSGPSLYWDALINAILGLFWPLVLIAAAVLRFFPPRS